MFRKSSMKFAAVLALAAAGSVPAMADSGLSIVATRSNFDALNTPQQIQFMITDGNLVPLSLETEMLNFQIIGGTSVPIISTADILTGTIFGAVPNYDQ